MKQSLTLTASLRTGTSTKKRHSHSYFTSEQIERARSIGELGLAVIAILGIVTVAAVAPNLLIAIDKFFIRKHKRRLTHAEKEEKTAQTIYYLKRHGLIHLKQQKGDWIINLTKLGNARITRLQFDLMHIAKPTGWDGKWWLVAGDIPTKTHRHWADLLRKKLKKLGFYSLQRTLWLYPYNPIKEINIVVGYYHLQRFITIMEIAQLDVDDKKLMMDHFRKEKIF